MGTSLIDDIASFSSAVEALMALRRQSIAARKRVCERSRFLRDSLLRASEIGRSCLTGPLAATVDHLFRRAIEALARRQDNYLRNVRRRYDGDLAVKPLLDEAVAAGLSAARRSARRSA